MLTEGFQYVAAEVYLKKTGAEMPPPVVSPGRLRDEPKGKRFDFDNKKLMQRRFPKLVQRLPEMGV